MMQRRGNGLRSTLLILAVALVAAACTAEGGASSQDEGRTVNVFGPFRGISAERFRASMAPFEEETGIEVRYVGSAGFAEAITERIDESHLPDIALFPQPALARELLDDGWLVPLPESVRSVAEASLRPEAFALGLDVDDYVGVMYRANVKSLIWYPPAAFRELGYEVPTTLEELENLVARMQRDGHAAWCIGLEAFTSSGWPGTDFVEDLVLRDLGPENYDRWVAGEIPFTDGRIEAAFSRMENMTRGRTLGGGRGALSTNVSTAQDPMFESPPLCLLHRQASFHETNLPKGTTIGPDGDTDVFLFPAAAGEGPPILSGGDLAAAFNDDRETIALLEYLADPRSGEAWARAGGFLSPHAEFDLDTYGTEFDRRMAEILSTAEVIRFDASDQMIPAVGTDTFLSAILLLFQTGDVQAAVELAQSGYGAD